MDIFFLLTLYSSKIINTFFHEMGHALPALKFTQGDVYINIGSYGDIENKKPIYQNGRLKIYFDFNVLLFGGYCRFEDSDSLTMDEYILIIFGGPFASLILAIFYALLYLLFKDISFLDSLFLSLFFTGLLDFIVNIVPAKMSKEAMIKGLIYNDGYQLKELMDEKRILYEKYTLITVLKNFLTSFKIKTKQKNTLPKENDYTIAIKLYKEAEYSKAILMFEKILKYNQFLSEPYRLIIECSIKLNDFEKALKYYQVLKSKFELSEEDKNNFILINDNLKTK